MDMAEAAKYTPGPLKVGLEPGYRDLFMVVDVSDPSTVACTASYCTEADATLYAAAPELLRALTETWRVLRAAGLSNLTRGVELGQTSWYVKISDAETLSDAAIAKATVQQPQASPGNRKDGEAQS